jgi:hypothetical protein
VSAVTVQLSVLPKAVKQNAVSQVSHVIFFSSNSVNNSSSSSSNDNGDGNN